MSINIMVNQLLQNIHVYMIAKVCNYYKLCINVMGFLLLILWFRIPIVVRDHISSTYEIM